MTLSIARLSSRLLTGAAAGLIGLALNSDASADTVVPPTRQVTPGMVFEPFSNTALPADVGKKAHTVLRVATPALDAGGKAHPATTSGPPFVGYNSRRPRRSNAPTTSSLRRMGAIQTSSPPRPTAARK